MAIKSADQITIVDVTDAYSIILTSEAYTFVGNSSGTAVGLTCSTQAVAYCGKTQCSSVTINQSEIICPVGISAAVTGSGESAPTITFTTTAVVADACEATIPVIVDGITINKKFSFAVAKAGTDGIDGKDGSSVTVKSTSVTYQAGSSGTTKPTGSWSSTIPDVSDGQYLWTKTYVEYSDGKSTESYSVSYKASNGSNGSSVSVTETAITYQAGSSGTTKPTGTWSSTIPDVADGQFLWTKTYVKYSDEKSTESYTVSYKASDGTNGEDAITITITSSNGTVFKNSSGSTVLTAHVFKGGVEQTINSNGVCGTSGSVKWYKGSDMSTVLSTSKTYTVSASAVTNSEVYTAQLEN